MKAKEYFVEYKDAFITPKTDDELTNACCGLIVDLCDEYIAIQEQRNIKTLEAAYALLRELNNKYVAIGNLLLKECGRPILELEGFKNIVNKKFPQLPNIWR